MTGSSNNHDKWNERVVARVAADQKVCGSIPDVSLSMELNYRLFIILKHRWMCPVKSTMFQSQVLNK